MVRCVLVALTLALTGLLAQSVSSVRPGLIYRAEGLVLLNDDAVQPNRVSWRHAAAGDAVRTHRGYCEILLLEATVLRAGGIALFEVAELERRSSVIELIGGSLVIDMADNFGRETVEIRTPSATVKLAKLGVYRIDAPSEGPPRVRVFQGRAVVQLDRSKHVVKKDRERLLEQGATLSKLDPSTLDSLDQWAANRRVALVEELLAALPEDAADKRPSSAHALEQLQAIRRRTEAEIRSSEAADQLWVK